MRRIVLVGILASSLVATSAWASGVGAIPVAVAAALVEAVGGIFQCHPGHEKLDLMLDTIEIDGVASSPTQSVAGLYVASDGSGQVIAALADPTSDPPGIARSQALVVPELQ
jgi:protein-disulfide isomerase